MKQIDEKTTGEKTEEVTALTCAEGLIDVTPQVMQVLRQEMRRHRLVEHSVPEFRTLSYIERHKGTSLTEIAEHIGLSKPSLSKIVMRLEESGLVGRSTSAEDKRRHTLRLTAQGQRTLDQIEQEALRSLAGRLAALAPDELGLVADALALLRAPFMESAGFSS